jgi:hypothetical protein
MISQNIHLSSWDILYVGSRGSAVSTATGYDLNDRGIAVRVPVVSRIFSSPRRPDRFWGPPSPLQWVVAEFSPWGGGGGYSKWAGTLPHTTKMPIGKENLDL